MIIVYAGSQPDATDRPTPRLPQAAEAELAVRLRGLMQSLKPSLVVGALAAGSDILFAESARQENVPVQILLPFHVDTFRETSVSAAGERWEQRYDRIIGSELIETLGGTPHDSSYTDHNAYMLDAAVKIAERQNEQVWCVLVRPKPADDAPASVTDDLAERAEGRSILTIDIDPVAERRRAFVVMPYGTKFDPIIRRDIDCDPVFHRIYRPLLEDLDLDWNRADLEVDSGIIHVGMIDDLANSDVVLADLTATNFNVAYEIGVRHVFARRSTVLAHPWISGQTHSSPPFDVAPIRAHSFERGFKLTDRQAEAAIKRLRPVMIEALSASQHTDSPIHEWFSVDSIVPPFSRRSVSGQVDDEIAARDQVRGALKSSAADPMLIAADLVAKADLAESTRRALRIELAIGLLAESEYSEALNLLEVAEPPMDNPLHRIWLHKSVMALRRVGERSSAETVRAEMLRRAEELLNLALVAGYADSESYGIWGGLLKRRLIRNEVEGLAAEATFQLMTEYYEKGFRADPQAYTGLNFAMALRVQGNLRELSEADQVRLDEALIVSRFLNGLSLDRDSSDPWALITDAELQLHTALAHRQDPVSAISAYARAAISASKDVRVSAVDQLRFLKLWGDPPTVIDPILDLFESN